MEENQNIIFDKYQKYKYKYIKFKNILKMNGGGKEENQIKTLYLFKADWCGHCIKFKPLWNKLKNEVSNVNFVEYDYNNNKKEIQQFNIKSYPTIILKHNNELIEYEGHRSFEEIKKFIESY
jgi:thiol-disulfide isomerase/thioredoxin